jgi:hypothetical protein
VSHTIIHYRQFHIYKKPGTKRIGIILPIDEYWSFREAAITSDHPKPTLDELITLAQAAELAELTPTHVRFLVSRGDMWGIKLGRNWFTTTQAVLDYLAKGIKPGPKAKKRPKLD